MRFRLVQRAKGAPRRRNPAPPPEPRPAPPPEPRPAPPKAAALDNPYGRYYGMARSREDLKK